MNIVCNTLQVEKVRTFTQKQPGTTAFHVTHVACHGIIHHDIYQMSLTHRIHKLNIRGLSHSYKVVECYRRTDRQRRDKVIPESYYASQTTQKLSLNTYTMYLLHKYKLLNLKQVVFLFLFLYNTPY